MPMLKTIWGHTAIANRVDAYLLHGKKADQWQQRAAQERLAARSKPECTHIPTSCNQQQRRR